jgi:predicted component of type VI protein secretion system
LALVVGDRTMRIERRQTVIGRGVGCDVVIARPLVSRQHARITLTEGHVFIEDLGSRNGVLVNSVAISKPTELEPGDVITIGDQSIALVEAQGVSPQHRTLVDLRAMRTEPPSSPEPEPPTQEANAFELLSGLVSKALVLGRAEQAERVLAGHLAILMERTEAGMPQSERDLALGAEAAIRLSLATRKAAWVEYAFNLYRAAKRPLPMPLVDELYSVLRTVRGIRAATLRSYVTTLEDNHSHFGPAEHFAVKRIAGLERLLT